MKTPLILTLLTTLAAASPTFHTTPKDTVPTISATTAVVAGNRVIPPPICTFNPAKGEYECPETIKLAPQSGVENAFTVDELEAALDDKEVSSATLHRRLQTREAPIVEDGDEGPVGAVDAVDAVVTTEGEVVKAADCNKCQHDWSECMQKWGCWFYDCNGPCKCQVAKNDPSCKECPAGQCHA